MCYFFINMMLHFTCAQKPAYTLLYVEISITDEMSKMASFCYAISDVRIELWVCREPYVTNTERIQDIKGKYFKTGIEDYRNIKCRWILILKLI